METFAAMPPCRPQLHVQTFATMLPANPRAGKESSDPCTAGVSWAMPTVFPRLPEFRASGFHPAPSSACPA